MNMRAYEWRRPLLPWWMVVPMAAAAAWILHGLYRDVFGNLLAMAPMAGIVVYLLLALLVNRTHVRVDAHGFRRTYGPIPLGPAEAPAPAPEVVRVYVRWAMAATRYGTHRYLTAGLETAGGRWIDITEPGEPEHAVWAAAYRLAEALGGQVPVEGQSHRGPGINKAALATVAVWFAAAWLAVVWAIAVQWIRSSV